MRLLFLEYPKLTISLSVPDDDAGAFRANFAHAIVSGTPASVQIEFLIRRLGTGVALERNGTPVGVFPDAAELMFALEEHIENALIERLDGWIGLHAGAVAMPDMAIVTVGHPDTGKTTTTFQLVELGLELLCEEVTPIDPSAIRVHPFPGVLTLDRGYAERFTSRYPVTHGALTFHGPGMARYTAGRVRRESVALGAMLFPRFDPSCTPGLEVLGPADVLTDIFQYCFTPTMKDEQLYDSVIRVIERCRLFRMHTRDIESARGLLVELLSELSPAGARPS